MVTTSQSLSRRSRARRALCALACVAAGVASGTASRAQGGAATTIASPGATPASSTSSSANEPPTSTPLVHHSPVTVATPHEPLKIDAWIDYPNLVQHAFVVYRLAGQAQTRSVPFLRGESSSYVAIIPPEDVEPPGLAYDIEVEKTDGTRIAAFAGRDAMHDVTVGGDIDDLRERALLAQLGGRRSVASGSFDWVYFGASSVSGPTTTSTVSDGYYRAEAAYTYRPLRFVVEFSIRGGIVRGTSPVPINPGIEPNDPKYTDKTKVGLNYGAPTVLLRFADFVHVEAELLTSVTEIGFSAGGGAAIHLGEVYGSKLVLGFESVKTFGTRGYARLDLVRPRWRVSPIIEVTDMPHADRAGVRLLAEIAFKLGQGWSIAARGGYQARDFQTGGPALGLSMAYAF